MVEESPLPSPPLLHQRRTRRAILGGGAALAAVGASAAVIAATRLGGDSDEHTATAEPPPDVAAPTPVPTPAPIDDPRQFAAHLLRRAGFGGTPAQVDEFAALSREDAVDRLLAFESVDNAALDTRLATMNLELADYGNGLVADMQRWWLARMAWSARPLEERMTLIWHGLLTSQLTKVGFQRAKLMVAQNNLFRQMALPEYGALLKAVSRDPAMLFYLDTVESTSQSPNENYARELMELYSMGVGNYTENDVRESARAFTGWRVTQPQRAPIRPDATDAERQEAMRRDTLNWEPQFIIQQRFHDNGVKTFLGRTGNFGGDDIVDIIMEQPATGRFMARRLFTEFANFNPAPEMIDGLAATWDRSGHQVREVVREILLSDEFASEASYRAFVRSPIEFIVGAVRGLEMEHGFQFTAQPPRGRAQPMAAAYRGMDQVLFEPHSVAGWPGGSTWLSSSTFFARVNFADQLLFPNGRPTPLPVLQGAGSTEAMVDAALDRLVDGRMEPASRAAIIEMAARIQQPQERAATIAYLVLSSPEYQLA